MTAKPTPLSALDAAIARERRIQAYNQARRQLQFDTYQASRAAQIKADKKREADRAMAEHGFAAAAYAKTEAETDLAARYGDKQAYAEYAAGVGMKAARARVAVKEVAAPWPWLVCLVGFVSGVALAVVFFGVLYLFT
jgi:hypothetical protein